MREADAEVRVAGDVDVLVEEERLVGEDRPAPAIADERRELERAVARRVAVRGRVVAAAAPVVVVLREERWWGGGSEKTAT